MDNLLTNLFSQNNMLLNQPDNKLRLLLMMQQLAAPRSAPLKPPAGTSVGQYPALGLQPQTQQQDINPLILQMLLSRTRNNQLINNYAG